MLPSSLFAAERCSFETQTVIVAFLMDVASMVQVSASLKMGEQLSDFLFVLSLPMTLSPMVTCILAWGSISRERERGGGDTRIVYTET